MGRSIWDRSVRIEVEHKSSRSIWDCFRALTATYRVAENPFYSCKTKTYVRWKKMAQGRKTRIQWRKLESENIIGRETQSLIPAGILLLEADDAEHRCSKQCHLGPCGTCDKARVLKCRCGATHKVHVTSCLHLLSAPKKNAANYAFVFPFTLSCSLWSDSQNDTLFTDVCCGLYCRKFHVLR